MNYGLYKCNSKIATIIRKKAKFKFKILYMANFALDFVCVYACPLPELFKIFYLGQSRALCYHSFRKSTKNVLHWWNIGKRSRMHLETDSFPERIDDFWSNMFGITRDDITTTSVYNLQNFMIAYSVSAMEKKLLLSLIWLRSPSRNSSIRLKSRIVLCFWAAKWF